CWTRMRAPEFWSANNFAARAAVACLSPLGWVYGAATNWKRTHASPYRAKAKVVCIGNLTAGGSGKTPVTLKVLALLRSRNISAFALSGGYGGRLSEPTVVKAGTHTAAGVGDEAMLLAAVAPTVVSKDRRLGAELAEREGADVIVMDDGYQNF